MVSDEIEPGTITLFPAKLKRVLQSRLINQNISKNISNKSKTKFSIRDKIEEGIISKLENKFYILQGKNRYAS